MDSYIGEIRILPYTYAPYQWAWCNGQQLSIAQNQALYAVIGAIFGGDGRTVFNLPNLTTQMGQPGCTPMGTGAGPGLTPRQLSQNSIGDSAVQLVLNQIPSHSHNFTAENSTTATDFITDPNQAWLGRGYVQGLDVGFQIYATPDPTKQVPFRADAINASGSNPVIAHENRQPSLAMNFCISLYGEFPVRP